jgi:hypothetical protein
MCHRTVCGLLMHSSLAVTARGLPLGLAAVKFWTRSMLLRTSPAASAGLVFTTREIDTLRQLIPRDPCDVMCQEGSIRRVARLGGYLARDHDPPPGNFVILRGMARLAEIVCGREVSERCG